MGLEHFWTLFIPVLISTTTLITEAQKLMPLSSAPLGAVVDGITSLSGPGIAKPIYYSRVEGGGVDWYTAFCFCSRLDGLIHPGSLTDLRGAYEAVKQTASGRQLFASPSPGTPRFLTWVDYHGLGSEYRTTSTNQPLNSDYNQGLGQNFSIPFKKDTCLAMYDPGLGQNQYVLTYGDCDTPAKMDYVICRGAFEDKEEYKDLAKCFTSRPCNAYKIKKYINEGICDDEPEPTTPKPTTTTTTTTEMPRTTCKPKPPCNKRCWWRRFFG